MLIMCAMRCVKGCVLKGGWCAFFMCTMCKHYICIHVQSRSQGEYINVQAQLCTKEAKLINMK